MTIYWLYNLKYSISNVKHILKKTVDFNNQYSKKICKLIVFDKITKLTFPCIKQNNIYKTNFNDATY